MSSDKIYSEICLLIDVVRLCIIGNCFLDKIERLTNIGIQLSNEYHVLLKVNKRFYTQSKIYF